MKIPPFILAILTVLLTTVVLHAAGTIPADVLTYHNDPARTGWQSHETTLASTNVTASLFGKKFSASVDGQVYAQPLYLGGVQIESQGRHNLIIAATEHDSVYAIDADSGTILWHVSFLNSSAQTTVTTVPMGDIGCSQITPEIGITATPAVDLANGVVYFVAFTKEVTGTIASYVQRVHALLLKNGAEQSGSPVIVQAQVAGTGDGTRDGNGDPVDVFIPKNYKCRPGLVLQNGVLYTAWSSHCDKFTYHGWVIGYDAHTLAQVSVFNNTPNGSEASFWSSGAAPAVDAAGNLYVVGGNGTFDVPTSPSQIPPDIGEAVIRLKPGVNSLIATDFFTPFNYGALNTQDLDIGTSGALLYDAATPGSTIHPHLLVSGGKEGRIYILDRDNLGHYSTNGSDSQIVQSLPKSANGLNGALFSIPAFYDGTLYFSAVGDYPKAFRLNADGTLPFAPTSKAAGTFGYPGSVPSISSSGTTNGIAWMIQNNGNAVLHAWDANNLATELYNTTQAASNRDALDTYVKFSAPTIGQGRVYVGTAAKITAFGPLTAVLPKSRTNKVTVTQGPPVQTGSTTYTQAVTLTNNSKVALTGPISLVFDSLPAPDDVTNADGTTTVAFPPASYYVNAPLTNNTLAVGAKVVCNIQFTVKSGKIRYTPRVLTGPGTR